MPAGSRERWRARRVLCWQRGGPKDGGGMRGHSPTPRLARPLVGRGLGGLKSCEGCARSFVGFAIPPRSRASSHGPYYRLRSARAASARLLTIETKPNYFLKQLGEGAGPRHSLLQMRHAQRLRGAAAAAKQRRRPAISCFDRLAFALLWPAQHGASTTDFFCL